MDDGWLHNTASGVLLPYRPRSTLVTSGMGMEMDAKPFPISHFPFPIPSLLQQHQPTYNYRKREKKSKYVTKQCMIEKSEATSDFVPSADRL